MIADLDVRRAFPRIIQPPSTYYDLENQKGSSPFRPGLEPEVYRAFIAYFDERAATCDAQARLDRRKRRTERAARYASLARCWREASRVALLRLQRELTTPMEVSNPVTDLFGRPIHKPGQQLTLGVDGRTRLGAAPAPPKAPTCPRCGADMARQLNAFGPDDWTCPECGHTLPREAQR